MTPPTAFRWFLSYGALFGTHWENQATWVEVHTPAPFDPQVCAPRVDNPVLMVIADRDEMPGADAGVARAVFDTIPGPKELTAVGGGHFGLLYVDSPDYERSASAQTSFLVRHLLGVAG